MTAASSEPKKFGMVIERLVKSTPPARRPTMGMTISLTSELTMAVKARPTATLTARSTTEPRLINSMNSLRKEDCSFLTFSIACLVELFISLFI